MGESSADRLKQARIKAGYKTAAAAAAAFGWTESAYRHHENGTRGFGVEQAQRYAKAFKVSPGWLLGTESAPALAPEPVHESTTAPQEAPKPPLLQKDLPVYGTALGADLEFISLDGHPVAVEQTELNRAEMIDQLRRLPMLQDERDAYALYVQGSSMSPAWEDGDPVLVTPKRQPRPGDYVVVQLVGPNGDEQEYTSVLLKRLIRRSGSYYELEQFNPPVKFRVEAGRIAKVHRVMRWSEAAGM